MHIHLIGPGGVGKSTVGQELAQQLGWAFYDLDAYFIEKSGNISAMIDGLGYEAYARQNVQNYLALLETLPGDAVLALSSGFMVYPYDNLPSYPQLKDSLASSPSTFVLLPALEIEACVKETLRRQLLKPYLNVNKAKEEAKIRKKFQLYMALECQKIITASAPHLVVTTIIEMLSANLTPGGE